MWSKARSTRLSKSAMRRRVRLERSGTAARLGDRDELLGLRGVATEGRAVGLERAPLAQARGPGPEVVALARPLHRGPDRAGPLLQAPDRLVARVGDDGQRLAQVQQLDAGRATAQHLLAQERVEVHAPQPALLEV